MATPKNWHPEDIKAACRKSGALLQDIAWKAGLDRSSTSHCLRRPIKAANEAIAAYLGLTVSDIWPEWFEADGSVKADWAKSITLPTPAQRQKRSAA